MSTSELDLTDSWVPRSCTLPTAERPLRVAEFDDLVIQVVRAVERPDPATLTLELQPLAHVAARVADLMVRETGCCSFFTFALTASGGALRLDITVLPAHIEVLDALAARVAAGVGS